jgi:choice-of-anchor C domain-containing protein
VRLRFALRAIRFVVTLTLLLTLLAAGAAFLSRSSLQGPASAATISSPNLVINGDFEVPAITSSYSTYPNGNSGITGWTVGGNSVDILSSQWPPAGGNQSIDLSGTCNCKSPQGSLSQDVPTVPRQTYTLGWYMAGNFNCDQTDKLMAVDFDGSPVVGSPFSFDESGPNGTVTNWTSHQVSVTATSDASSISFADVTPDKSECGSTLDSVSLYAGAAQSPTPSPLTIDEMTVPLAGVARKYSTTLIATGGTAPYTWTLQAGTLPAGLELEPPTGVISGAPTKDASSKVTLEVSDASSEVAAVPLVVKVVGLASGDLVVTPTTAIPGTTIHIRGFNPCPLPPGTTSRPKGLDIVLTFGLIHHGTFNFMEGFARPVQRSTGGWSATYQLPTFGVAPGTFYGEGGDLAGKSIDTKPGNYYINAACSLNENSLGSYYNYAYREIQLVAILPQKSSAGPAISPGNVAPIASQLGTPRQIFGSVSHDVANAVITVGLVLFIAFPATIFNQTFATNYDEIVLMAKRGRRKLKRRFSRREEGGSHNPQDTPLRGVAANENETPGRATSLWFIVTLAVGAVFAGFLNPKFGFNTPSLELFGGTLVAILVAATTPWIVARIFRRFHHYSTATYLRALPFGLLVALVCVVVSRLTNFEPGYLYGIVIGFGFAGSLKDRHNAYLIGITSLATLLVGLLAWLAWIPMNSVALGHGANVIEVMCDDALATIFVGALVSTVLLLLPLEGLPGGHLTKWRRDAWALIFFVALFLLVSVELRPQSGPTHPGGAPVVTAIALFLFFGAMSFGIREYFKRRSTSPGNTTVLVEENLTPNEGGTR